jgi:Flp pilus assembly protein TadD
MITDSSLLEAIQEICDRLSERTATLFLGAGINANVKDGDNAPFPLGNGLAKWLAEDLLEDPNLTRTLPEVAEMARYRVGEPEVNRYIYDRFSRFKPGVGHLALVQLPWDVIYTTNYDLFAEEAAKLLSEVAAGPIRPVCSIHTDLSSFTEDDILYYKLHGSVDVANTEEGRLILTREDYRHYGLHRKPLFKRLERDLLSRTFLFVGYSLSDSNFKDILQDCRDELEGKTFPNSFAVLHDFSSAEETFWRGKYNIQLLKADADEFLSALKETWIQQDRSVVPFESRSTREYLQVDRVTRFSKVSDSFYRVRQGECTGPSNAELFFRGAEPSWADIRAEIAPKRDTYYSLLDAMFPELAEPDLPPSAYLVTGAAGTGKTTLLLTMAYDLAEEFTVLAHVAGTPLDTRLLNPVVDNDNPARIIVVVRHAADYLPALDRFMEESRRRSLAVTLLLEERRNQWNVASQRAKRGLAPAEFELGPLSASEIRSILDALQEHDALGKLTETSRTYQEKHFTRVATKELLVALRELTSQSSFDEIVRDEYARIPSEAAKKAYTYVAALGQLNLPVRYEILMHLLDLRADQLRSEIFTPGEGVLISGEESGSSRHNAGFNLRARHTIIASIIFAQVAADDESKYRIINELLSQLDPGFPEDRRVLEAIVRGRELVDTIASNETRRAIYERLENILPNSSYVLQHRSILERRLNNPRQAVRYARRALSLNRGDPTLATTLGFALELEARSADHLRQQALLSEATQLFDEVIKRDPKDPYGYIGKATIIRQSAQNENDHERRKLLQANELSLLEEAYEATEESNLIANALAQARNQMGDTNDAVDIVRAGLMAHPTDNRLRDLWIRLEVEKGHPDEALRIAEEGVIVDPTSWRMQRHIARLKRTLGEHLDAVVGHYEAAIRHHRADISLLVELGAYLFINRRYSQANQAFAQARDLAMDSLERRKFRELWTDSEDNRVVFSGRVNSIHGSRAWAMAIPENFEAFFWRTRPELSALREGDPVAFYVKFNAYGPSAFILT